MVMGGGRKGRVVTYCRVSYKPREKKLFTTLECVEERFYDHFTTYINVRYCNVVFTILDLAFASFFLNT